MKVLVREFVLHNQQFLSSCCQTLQQEEIDHGQKIITIFKNLLHTSIKKEDTEDTKVDKTLFSFCKAMYNMKRHKKAGLNSCFFYLLEFFTFTSCF